MNSIYLASSQYDYIEKHLLYVNKFFLLVTIIPHMDR